jgi:hypothetical protein
MRNSEPGRGVMVRVSVPRWNADRVGRLQCRFRFWQCDECTLLLLSKNFPERWDWANLPSSLCVSTVVEKGRTTLLTASLKPCWRVGKRELG